MLTDEVALCILVLQQSDIFEVCVFECDFGWKLISIWVFVRGWYSYMAELLA